MRPVLFDLDRTLVDLQTYTDYAAAPADVEVSIGFWDDPPAPATDWDAPTRRCMSILVALSGDPRWSEVSDLIAGREVAAVPSSRPSPRLAEALPLVRHRPAAVVTLVSEEAARAVLRRHGVDIPVLVARRPPSGPPAQAGRRPDHRSMPVAWGGSFRLHDDRRLHMGFRGRR